MSGDNGAERAAKPIALGRNTCLFVHSEGSGKLAALSYILNETTKLNGNNSPNDVPGHIAGHIITRIDAGHFPGAMPRSRRSWPFRVFPGQGQPDALDTASGVRGVIGRLERAGRARENSPTPGKVRGMDDCPRSDGRHAPALPKVAMVTTTTALPRPRTCSCRR